jgi:intracellular septation protein
MKPLLDFLPLLAFFAAYKLKDIYWASGVLIIVTSVQYLGYYFYYKKLQRSEWLTWMAVLLFCSMTLLLHNESILKWKAPVLYWVLALSFLLTPWFTGVTLTEKMMGKAVQLTAAQWRNLNYSWVLFFIFAGIANAYVAFYHASIWVDFKVFGSLGMTLVFVLIQGVFLYRYMTPTPEAAKNLPLEDKARDAAD